MKAKSLHQKGWRWWTPSTDSAESWYLSLAEAKKPDVKKLEKHEDRKFLEFEKLRGKLESRKSQRVPRSPARKISSIFSIILLYLSHLPFSRQVYQEYCRDPEIVPGPRKGMSTIWGLKSAIWCPAQARLNQRGLGHTGQLCWPPLTPTLEQ